MPTPFEIKIESVLSGISPSDNYGKPGGYDVSIGIDPDFPSTDSSVRPSGFLRPTAMEKFSGSKIASSTHVLWMQTSPKSNTNVFLYLLNGKLIGYDTSLANETDIGTPTSGAGNGMAYYDNYIYLATPTDISRHGPLNGAQAIANTYWSSTLSLAVLTNTTYPSINGVTMPNHVMHRHTDAKLYICDVLSNTTANTNKGALHYIKTTKTTVEGDTNDGSTYNALDFPWGMYPSTLETYGTDLCVALFEGTSTTIRQRRAKLSFWDTTSSSFQKIHEEEFPDPLITAMKNVNGILYVWSGSATGGCRLTRFVGGYTMEEVFYNPDIFPPLQGAVDHIMNRIVFGTGTTYPDVHAAVFGVGSMAGLGSGTHGILKTTATGATQMVTALKYVQNSALPKLSPIVAWKSGTGSDSGVDKLSTTYGTSVWRSEKFRFGGLAEINEVEIPLVQPIQGNMTLVAKLLTNNLQTTTTLATINNTNYTASQTFILIPTAGLLAKNDSLLELTWSGTVLLTVGLPIIIRGNKLY